MPRRRQRQAKPVGPYDLSTIQLPFGSELDALASGFARQRAGRQGYTEAAVIANQQLLEDTRNSYIVVDLNSPHAQIGRAMTRSDMFEKYQADIEHTLPGTHVNKVSHDIKRAMGIPRGQSIDVGLPGQYIYKPSDNVYIAHVKSARIGLGMKPVPKTTTAITDNEMEQLLLTLYT